MDPSYDRAVDEALGYDLFDDTLSQLPPVWLTEWLTGREFTPGFDLWEQGYTPDALDELAAGAGQDLQDFADDVDELNDALPDLDDLADIGKAAGWLAGLYLVVRLLGR